MHCRSLAAQPSSSQRVVSKAHTLEIHYQLQDGLRSSTCACEAFRSWQCYLGTGLDSSLWTAERFELHNQGMIVLGRLDSNRWLQGALSSSSTLLQLQAFARVRGPEGRQEKDLDWEVLYLALRCGYFQEAIKVPLLQALLCHAVSTANRKRDTIQMVLQDEFQTEVYKEAKALSSIQCFSTFSGSGAICGCCCVRCAFRISSPMSKHAVTQRRTVTAATRISANCFRWLYCLNKRALLHTWHGDQLWQTA